MFKSHLVSWKRICTPLNLGGLGSKSLFAFNQALFGKWLWRYVVEGGAFWRQVVDRKYGSLVGKGCSKVVTGP